ncbi:EPIDERMAL PATTERNING FACTOR-like protein 4 [Corchorus olitorius]|uniref:Epidermal patterning factor-like protein n=1 Tax=Corchorus olitorius TaxID=93759 RepID=A0A1R3K5J2_9ROSI|nr:EPIDERMAL PATTERNING FACTOR-like protein 4 [Corchorus olitorius]
MESKRCRKLNLTHKLHCLSLFFFSVFALFTISGSTATTFQQDISCSLSGQADTLCFQEIAEERKHEENINVEEEFHGVVLPLSLARRFLSGPGSSPPRCTSKCGSCTPCKPVHVPVPPGTPVTAEYYPEAWRCKCGNKLYMP